jgi:hypothetical protein
MKWFFNLFKPKEIQYDKLNYQLIADNLFSDQHFLEYIIKFIIESKIVEASVEECLDRYDLEKRVKNASHSSGATKKLSDEFMDFLLLKLNQLSIDNKQY